MSDWRIDYAGYNGPYIREARNGHEVARISGTSFEEKRARCRLFVAAPDLLEACRSAADFLAAEFGQVSDPDNKQGWSGDPAAYENYRSLRAAITKAEGA